jgi:hypothetical protein
MKALAGSSPELCREYALKHSIASSVIGFLALQVPAENYAVANWPPNCSRY